MGLLYLYLYPYAYPLNRVLRRIFVPRRDEVTREWKKTK